MLASLEQLGVRALLDNGALIDDCDLIGVTDCVEPVGDHDGAEIVLFN